MILKLILWGLYNFLVTCGKTYRMFGVCRMDWNDHTICEVYLGFWLTNLNENFGDAVVHVDACNLKFRRVIINNFFCFVKIKIQLFHTTD